MSLAISRMRWTCVAACIVAFSVVSTAQTPPATRSAYEWEAPGFVLNGDWEGVRILQLLAGTEPVRPRKVHVTGVLSVEFEDECLYLTLEHYQRHITENCVRLGLSGVPDGRLEPFQGQYVKIFGTLKAIPGPRFPHEPELVRIQRVVVVGPSAENLRP